MVFNFYFFNLTTIFLCCSSLSLRALDSSARTEFDPPYFDFTVSKSLCNLNSRALSREFEFRTVLELTYAFGEVPRADLAPRRV